MGKELEKYARTLPWAKEFKIVKYDMFTWEVNGHQIHFRGGFDIGEAQTHKGLMENKRKFARKEAQDIEDKLKDDYAVFILDNHLIFSVKNRNDLIDILDSLLKNAKTLPERKNLLFDYFNQTLKIDIDYSIELSEYLSVFWYGKGE